MNYLFIKQRITYLRIQKGVSEYQMSLDLGHSRSYIQNIASGRSKPSIEEFLYICEYLNISPQDFFDERQSYPAQIQKAVEGMQSLSDKDLKVLLSLIEILNDHHNTN